MFVEKKVTVGELKELYDSGKYNIEIDTPDGYQSIGGWFDKGKLPMVNIGTDTYNTICATNHMIQTPDLGWVLADELSPGDVILTESGEEAVIFKAPVDPQECYDFEVLHPNHRYWGDGISSHNSGKSFICAGNVIRNAQEQGIYVVLIDSENALDEKWLKGVGVDTNEDKLLKLNMAMIDDVAKTISEFMKEYKTIPEDEKPKVLFVVDSLGMLLTPTDIKQFDDGDLKGDMGRKPKALTALVRNCVNMFGSQNVGLVATNHSYASQDMFDPDDKISGGQGFIYASSIVVAMRKLKLKEDDDGNKISDVTGIRAQCKIMKTRYNKPFEQVEIKIPYETGMNPYSGMVEFFESQHMLTKDGNSLRADYLDGTTIKQYRKEWVKNTNSCLDKLMDDFVNKPANTTTKEEVVENVE